MAISKEQWAALSEFIKSEAKYASDENFNRNDCGDSSRRYEIEQACERALVNEGIA